MIVVKVELWSAITHRKTELARMLVSNTGESDDPRVGDYDCVTFRGRDEATLDAAMRRYLTSRELDAAAKSTTRRGQVKNHRRLDQHVWNLIAKALTGMGYGSAGAPAPAEEPVGQLGGCRADDRALAQAPCTLCDAVAGEPCGARHVASHPKAA